jgi:hypothetical protein
MKSFQLAAFVAALICIPTTLFFKNLPVTLFNRGPPHEYDVIYSAEGEPLTINLEKSKISFAEFQQTFQGKYKSFTRAELRKVMQEYLEPRLVMWHRTPCETCGFDTEWKHTSSLLVAKTVKNIVNSAIFTEKEQISF